MSVVCDVSFDEMAIALSYMSLVGGAAGSASAPAPAVPASTAKGAPKATPATARKDGAPASAVAREVAPMPNELPPAPTEAPTASGDAPPVPKETKKNVEEDDDMDDLFDEDGLDAPPASKQDSRAEKMAAAKAEKQKKKKVDKSQIVFEVKPWEADQDLVSLFHKISQVGVDGLTWGQAYKLVPVAFGVKKLVLSCVVEDDKVGVEDITDVIEKFEDEVQSVDMTTMNRL